jgi:hypothetical protein
LHANSDRKHNRGKQHGACVRACKPACVRAFVRAFERSFVRACVSVTGWKVACKCAMNSVAHDSPTLFSTLTAPSLALCAALCCTPMIPRAAANKVGHDAGENWWRFTAASNAIYVFNSCGSSYDTWIHIYQRVGGTAVGSQGACGSAHGAANADFKSLTARAQQQ